MSLAAKSSFFLTTSTSNWMVVAQVVHGNPSDGATLTNVLEQTALLTGIKPEQAAVDQGC